MKLTLILTFGVSLFLFSFLVAEVPDIVNYQGRITTPEGDPVPDGQYKITFRIYDNEAKQTLVWSEAMENVSVVNGLFSVFMGAMGNLDEALYDGHGRYMTLDIDDQGEMPVFRLASAPFAIAAEQADTAAVAIVALGVECVGCINSDHLASGSVTQAKIAGNAVTTSQILNGTIGGDDLASNGASPGQVLKYNGSTWNAADDETGTNTSGWVDNGASVYLETGTDNVGIGTTIPNAKLDVHGSLVVEGSATLKGTSTFYTNVYTLQNLSANNVSVAGNLTWGAKTGYVSIPATAFDGFTASYEPDGMYVGVSSSNQVLAPVYLPDGATLTEVTVNAYIHTVGGHRYDLFLVRNSGFGVLDTLGHTYVTGGGNYSKQITTFTDPVVDNSTYSYFLVFEATSGRIYNVLIEYTSTEPH